MVFGLDDAAFGSIVGAGIGAGGNLLGGLFGGAGADSRNAAQMRLAREQINFQKDLAQQGIRWRVFDAQQAGIHPLFALGANPGQFSPVSVSQEAPDYSWMGRMGQDIGRAVQATMTQEERAATKLAQMSALEDQRRMNQAQLELIKSQTAKNLAAVNPPMPGSVGGSTGVSGAVVNSPALGVHEMKPAEPITRQPGGPANEAGPVNPAIKWMRSGDGIIPVPSKASGIDDQDITNLGYLEFLVRNRLVPFAGVAENKPTLNEMRAEFGPGVTGMQYAHGKWYPLYGGEKGFIERYRAARDRAFDWKVELPSLPYRRSPRREYGYF